jgi:hypothetical protein
VPGSARRQRSDKAVALIPDFADGLLDLNVQGSGSGANLMDFVRKSPIGNRQADTLAKLNLGGSGNFDFHLALPLNKPTDAQLNGNAQLHDVDVTAPDWNLKLRQAQRSTPASTCTACRAVHWMPFIADSHPNCSWPSPAATPIRTRCSRATAPAATRSAEMVQDYPSLQWLGKLADGRSDFTVGFAIAHAAGSDALAQKPQH